MPPPPLVVARKIFVLQLAALSLQLGLIAGFVAVAVAVAVAVVAAAAGGGG